MCTREHFSKRDNVKQALTDARKHWGLCSTTKAQFDKIIDTLAFAFLYCPEDMKDIVEYSINEAKLRAKHAPF